MMTRLAVIWDEGRLEGSDHDISDEVMLGVLELLHDDLENRGISIDQGGGEEDNNGEPIWYFEFGLPDYQPGDTEYTPESVLAEMELAVQEWYANGSIIPAV